MRMTLILSMFLFFVSCEPPLQYYNWTRGYRPGPNEQWIQEREFFRVKNFWNERATEIPIWKAIYLVDKDGERNITDDLVRPILDEFEHELEKYKKGNLAGTYEGGSYVGVGPDFPLEDGGWLFSVGSPNMESVTYLYSRMVWPSG